MANHQDVGDALLLLAGQFHSEGSVMSAIRCLEAVAQAQDPLYPLTEGRARRQLAALLLAHSNNVLEAKVHLEKTQLLLANVHGNWDLKLGVISDLGRCHKLLGNVRLQHQMYQTGLQECRNALESRGCPTADLWEVHFLLRLADSLVTSGESGQALSMIEAGISQVAARQQDERIQILCLLFALQLQMVEWAPSDTSERIMLQASSLFSSLPAERHNERLTLQLKLHFHILRVLFLLRLGHNSELSTAQVGGTRASWMPAVVCAIEDLVAQLGLGGPEEPAWEYEWMPPEAVLALVHLLCAQILLPCAKLKHVLGHLQKCQSVVEMELRRLGVNYSPAPQGGSRELELAHHTIWDSRLLIVFRFLALEAQAQVFLTMADLSPAQECIQGAAELVRSFPMLLQQLRPSAHMLAGLYCHSMACYSEAITCFEASKAEAPSAQWANLAACQAALSWLGTGAPYAAQNAMAALGSLGDKARALGDAPEAVIDQQGLSLQERALSLLSMGLAARDLGASGEAKALLMKALRVAHGPLSNQQLICQVLNALAPISMEVGDADGAHQMLSNSFQVGKSIYDTPSMVRALGNMQPLLIATGQAPQAQQNHEYAARKAAEVNQAAGAAASTPGHRFILGYAAVLYQEQQQMMNH